MLPFDNFSDENVDGRAISASITSEMHRIGQIHKIKFNSRQSERLPLPPKSISAERLARSFESYHSESQSFSNIMSNTGILTVGKITFPLGSMLISLKRLIPFGDSVIISGNFQKADNLARFIAHVDHRGHGGICICEVTENYPKKTMYEYIKDLSYKIAFDISNVEMKNLFKAKTWEGFKNFTDSFEGYYNYTVSNKIEELDHAYDNCLKAIKAEQGYSILFGLLYNMGIAYYDLENYEKAECMFRCALDIQMDAGAYSGLGASLRWLYRFKESYEASIDAIECDSKEETIKISSPYSNIASIYLDLGLYSYSLYDKSIKKWGEAQKIDKDDPIIYLGLGMSYYRKKDYDKAIQNFKIAEEKATVDGSPRGLVQLVNLIEKAACYKKIGESDEFDKLISLIRGRISSENLINRASFEAIQGNDEKALKLIEEALVKNRVSIPEIRFDPDFESLLKNEKFLELMEKHKHNVAQVTNIRDFLAKENEFIRASFEASIGNNNDSVNLLKDALINRITTFDEIQNDPRFNDILSNDKLKTEILTYSRGFLLTSDLRSQKGPRQYF